MQRLDLQTICYDKHSMNVNKEKADTLTNLSRHERICNTLNEAHIHNEVINTLKLLGKIRNHGRGGNNLKGILNG